MGLVTPNAFSVAQIGKDPDGTTRNCVRISLAWNPPQPGPVNLGPLAQVQGNYFIFNPLAITPAQIGSIKSIAFRTAFLTNPTGFADSTDGNFLIYDQGSGTIYEITPNIDSELDTDTNIESTATGVLSLGSPLHSNITIFKSAQQASGLCYGRTEMTLYDFEIAPWVLPAGRGQLF